MFFGAFNAAINAAARRLMTPSLGAAYTMHHSHVEHASCHMPQAIPNCNGKQETNSSAEGVDSLLSLSPSLFFSLANTQKSYTSNMHTHTHTRQGVWRRDWGREGGGAYVLMCALRERFQLINLRAREHLFCY